ncbi:hypothetical protein B4065_1654 [Caldibacillus thermoamylovorans]|uniref:O-unit flippase-like protein n=1 Tax=Caldibacillus thermoamylovorans TaxID=35841 RepID=UPI0005B70194|nr:O-unit flippase-like protein [Caldibacillus thermoamylovorans]KIO68305.1 hypothetical protein B4065_1654 [Caldibacillus thermoamylovorans]
MKITKRDIIWGYLGTILRLAINVILLPIVYSFLTSDELGIWAIYISVAGIVNLLDFGFTPTLSRNIAYSWSGANELKKQSVNFVNKKSGPNIELFTNVLKVSQKIYLLISLVAVIILLSIGTVYINYVARNFTGDYLWISWLIFILALFLNIYMGYYASFLKGVGAIYEFNKATVISKVFQILITIILLILGFGLIGVTFAYLINGFLYRFLCRRYFYKYEDIGHLLKKYNFDNKYNEVKKYFSIIFHNAWREGVVSVSSYLTTQASTIMCSLFLTVSETGIYSISLQIVTVIQNVSSVLYTVYQPSMQEAYIKNNKDKSKRLMATAMLLYTILFMIGSILISTIGVYLLELIKPTSNISSLFTLIMCIYIFLLQHHQLYASYISNTNRLPYVRAFILSGIATIIIEYLLLKYTNIGVWSLLIGPIIVQLCYNNWKWPKFVLRLLDTDILEMAKIGMFELHRLIGNILRKNQSDEMLSRK